ncbi:MAG: SDR family NAD(P)-dependent oxidoreductase [Deltaproteobacteria bacterium]|nr:MAG: SDR family NAD(P)-dependent oxidoreductase [Deltaproteobacteria bacterium]
MASQLKARQAVIHLTHHALPQLRAAKRAAVINIASVSSKHTHAGGAIYCASKHALLGFSNCLFEDVRDEHIKVCAICPGYVATDMIKGVDVEMKKAIQPADIAHTVLYVLDCGATACPTEIVVRPQQSM